MQSAGTRDIREAKRIMSELRAGDLLICLYSFSMINSRAHYGAWGFNDLAKTSPHDILLILKIEMSPRYANRLCVFFLYKNFIFWNDLPSNFVSKAESEFHLRRLNGCSYPISHQVFSQEVRI